MVEARRPDIIFVDKQAKVAKIINIVEVPVSSRRNRKVVEVEESDGCANNVIGALRAVSLMSGKYTRKLKVTIRLEVIQRAALLRTLGQLGKVLSI